MSQTQILNIIASIIFISVIASITYAFTGPSYGPNDPNSSSGSFVDQIAGLNFNISTDSLEAISDAIANLSSGGTPEFYTTSSTYAIPAAASACDTGFHVCFAGEWIGHKINSSKNCDGCNDNGAWFDSNTNATISLWGDCSNFTSNSASHYGGIVTAGANNSSDTAGWTTASATCDQSNNVVCCSD